MRKLVLFLINLILIICLASCNALKVQSCSPIMTMSTQVDVTFYNVDDYVTHYDKIKEIYNEVDRVSSCYEPNDNNSVYELNLNRSINASDLLYDMLITARDLTSEIDSYFNIYMGRLNVLWKEAISNNIVLAEDVIRNELEIIKNTYLEFNDKTITLVGDGNIDLGGIAKGYATQKAKEYLDSVGVSSYLINAGSSNVVFGHKNEDVFKIGLEKPYSNGYITVIEGKNMAIGTSSGKHQNAVIDGKRYHHIINPQTGYPENIYDNVNVIFSNSTLCDIYSTALFSMSLEEAKAFAIKKDIKIILFKDDKVIYSSEGIILWKNIEMILS